MPTQAEVADLLSSNSSILYVARFPSISSPIVGMVTLVIFQVPSGIRAHIEDLVVDHDLRNKGIAHALMKKALLYAQRQGANGVLLTSNSSRISALKLYERLGFKKWDTNIFFHQFKG
jgi:ribosomal protein S18 acetylase RimI-like enzyme